MSVFVFGAPQELATTPWHPEASTCLPWRGSRDDPALSSDSLATWTGGHGGPGLASPAWVSSELSWGRCRKPAQTHFSSWPCQRSERQVYRLPRWADRQGTSSEERLQPGLFSPHLTGPGRARGATLRDELRLCSQWPQDSPRPSAPVRPPQGRPSHVTWCPPSPLPVLGRGPTSRKGPIDSVLGSASGPLELIPAEPRGLYRLCSTLGALGSSLVPGTGCPALRISCRGGNGHSRRPRLLPPSASAGPVLPLDVTVGCDQIVAGPRLNLRNPGRCGGGGDRLPSPAAALGPSCGPGAGLWLAPLCLGAECPQADVVRRADPVLVLGLCILTWSPPCSHLQNGPFWPHVPTRDNF
ncbi:uncharacterized protein LOC117795927 isoform X2 [Ailuropoda melanoleuca]|uniref:uncharacterized protein LOC117795927 isoform X2 n=1 Tax=Ailuropoda melanoleuca TaxID=9646 RepID=UPI0014943254|nr:uncharacterized protein LOC117795927 isoform X2 [Ailuropoda melanoleuca]